MTEPGPFYPSDEHHDLGCLPVPGGEMRVGGEAALQWDTNVAWQKPAGWWTVDGRTWFAANIYPSRWVRFWQRVILGIRWRRV